MVSFHTWTLVLVLSYPIMSAYSWRYIKQFLTSTQLAENLDGRLQSPSISITDIAIFEFVL